MNANLNGPFEFQDTAARVVHRCRTPRGYTFQSILTTVVGVVVFSAAVVYMDPSLVPAAIRPTPKTQPVINVAAHEEFTALVSQMLEGCEEVLAIQQNVTTASVDVILWLHDLKNAGTMDNNEIAILSHDRLSRLLTMYSMEDGPGTGVAGAASIDAASAESTEQTTAKVASKTSKVLTPRTAAPASATQRVRYYETISRSTLSDPLFKSRWRTQPGVKAQVLTEGLSDLRLEPVNNDATELSHLRLWLRWAADSADGADERTAIINRAAPQTAPQE